MSMSDSMLVEAISYFRSNKGFQRIFDRMRKKYQSLGTMGGTIELRNMLPEEREALTGFLRKNYMNQKSASIKLENFQKALEHTKFSGLLLEDILNDYFGEELISNKVAKERYQQEQDEFFANIIRKFEGTTAGQWLRDTLKERNNAYYIFMQRYNINRERLGKDIEDVCRALEQLPILSGEKFRLPVFASSITSNPHSFDSNTTCGLIFLYALAWQFGVGRPVNVEETAELYYVSGILFDEVSNYVLCNGLKAYKDGNLHPGWNGFYNCKESLQVSLANLSTVDKVVSPLGKVYVFENAGVFSAVLDKLSWNYPPLVCTYGQVRLSSLVLLDMLSKEGTMIYYSGDFDPEGLRIADRLQSRYGDQLILWRYGATDYKKALSYESLDDVRLKKMDNIVSPDLVDLSLYIRQHACAGYQELIIDDLVNDILTS